jgi:uroporphyrinogen decarboxylase
MTPREIILRNLEGNGPERIGMDFTGGRMDDFGGAGLSASTQYEQRRWTEGQFEFYDDEWGNVWHRIIGMSSGGEIYRPVLEDWSALDSLTLPDMDAAYRYETAAAYFKSGTQQFRLGHLPGFPFAVCRYMRKMEIYFQDLLLEREYVDELHRRVTEMLERMVIRWADAGADGIVFCEDWGVQNRLLIHPNRWREIYKPLFAQLVGAARSRGMHVLMHSCGFVWDIIDDLADVGIRCLQFDQPGLYGLERLNEKLGARGVCLWSPVDIQQVMPTGDRDLIESEARKMVELFSGRFIAKNYPDLHGIGVEPEWDAWAYDVFERAARAQESTPSGA